ncbi:aminotransferase class V-fold PLP-dependent enzyme [Streptomyces sp. NBC_01233]|nr:aminotransferase class V-fold PLP-dependent enzyme [Streptomyces sp. NBC_01233]
MLETCRALERLHGAKVTLLPVDREGLVEPKPLAAAFTEDTVLVSVKAANNETGALQPVAGLATPAHEHGALFHRDAAQAAGQVPLAIEGLGSRRHPRLSASCSPQPAPCANPTPARPRHGARHRRSGRTRLCAVRAAMITAGAPPQ